MPEISEGGVRDNQSSRVEGREIEIQERGSQNPGSPLLQLVTSNNPTSNKTPQYRASNH
ncbi:hypothetical protein NQZ68_024589 [Dissostichus eleginoides]|nr:hypothetical protein NQZ68_024589 [Dissostichus eleginoides]